MRRQDPSYGEVVHASFYEFMPFAEEVIALRLGARRRSTKLCVCVLRGVRTLVLGEGVAYKECARTPAIPRYQEFNVHKEEVLLVTPALNALMVLNTTE